MPGSPADVPLSAEPEGSRGVLCSRLTPFLFFLACVFVSLGRGVEAEVSFFLLAGACFFSFGCVWCRESPCKISTATAKAWFSFFSH